MPATLERPKKEVYDRPTAEDVSRIMGDATKNTDTAREFLFSVGVSVDKNGKIVVKPI